MRMVKVYFDNGNVAVFPAEKVSFKEDNTFFMLHDSARETVEPAHYSDLIADGRVLVNWTAVSWVKEYEEPQE